MKPYNTAEFKKRAREYVKDKSCEWCKKKAGDTYTDRKGKERKISLAPHHRKKPQLGLRVYKRLATAHFKAYFADGANKDEYEELYERARSELHEKVEEKDILERLRFKWEERHRPEIKAKYDAYRKSAELDYLELTPKKTIVLCNRCHYAREKGLVLCRVCGEHYHKPKYPMCLECAQKMTP